MRRRDINKQPPSPTPAEVGCWQRVLRQVLGTTTRTVGAGDGGVPPAQELPQLTQEEEARRAAEFLDEPPFWRE